MEVEVIIKPDGTVITETFNVTGDACERQVRPLHVRLGEIDTVDQKPEYDEQPSHTSTSINY